MILSQTLDVVYLQVLAMASHKPHDLQDYTPEELDRMRRRQELRARLKAEFNRYIYDPFRFHHRIELV